MSESESLEFAMKKIELARLDDSDLQPTVQALSVNFEKDLCFLHMTQDILNHMKEGQVLTIRGELNDQAVICTSSETYELKDAETSNSLMLVPELIWPEEDQGGPMRLVPQKITGIFHDYYEMRRVKPSFKKLRNILDQSAFKGKEYESEIDHGKYTFGDLLDIIQSSEKELESALEEMQTCVIDGFMRILDFDYKFNVVSSVINVIESNSIPIDKIDKEVVISSLEDLEPRVILETFFLWFANSSDENGQTLFALKEDAICRLYGELLLRVAGKFHLEEFMESWQKSVPEGLKCSLEHLKGLALTDLTCSPTVIFHFPYLEMPENIAERFIKLFKVKTKWTYEEIVPYLEDRVHSLSEVKALLVKYTRESTKDGIKLYSSKW
ncbi:sister chromatid cohesion protein DCC1-like [Uloborus diversus]|uniref:sister chromatid cohesion protein DCC1-like n=1 Tax=Uloborus diversus TaxID=327109 RepID=UPI00240A5A4D|nr:sister chromatid cohesion protein DCC1-like [Uloborus diversus]